MNKSRYFRGKSIGLATNNYLHIMRDQIEFQNFLDIIKQSRPYELTEIFNPANSYQYIVDYLTGVENDPITNSCFIF